jgi:hypothetical protein
MKTLTVSAVVGRALGLAVLALTGALLLAPARADAMSLPGMDLTAYCRNTYGASAYATLTSDNAFGWTCRMGSQNYGMNLSAACQQQLTHGYEAAYLDYANPYSWYCRLRTGYTSMSGTSYTMYAWKGRNVALRVPNSNCGTKTGADATRAIMKIIDALDNAYDFYQEQTSRYPTQSLNYQGLLSIAALPAGTTLSCTPGNFSACGYVGTTGIELTDSLFQAMCDSVSETPAKYQQTPFYELGRNFYFYSDTLTYKAPQNIPAVPTGFAVAMRFLAMEDAGLLGAPINGNDFNTFKTAVKNLVDTYRTTPSLSWSNTLASSSWTSNPYNLGSPDLFASIVLRLERQHPGQFVYNVWWRAQNKSAASTTAQAVDNFVSSACEAASANLYDLFKTTWKFDVTLTHSASICGLYGAPVNPAGYTSP